MSTSAEPIDVSIALQELNAQLHQCENGEGGACNSIEESVAFHAKVCTAMHVRLTDWAQRVFSGQIAFDAEVELQFKQGLQYLVKRASSVAIQGMEMNGVCCGLSGINELCQYIVYFEFQLANWVTPKRSVGPAARVKIPEVPAKQIAKRLEELSSM